MTRPYSFSCALFMVWESSFQCQILLNFGSYWQFVPSCDVIFLDMEVNYKRRTLHFFHICSIMPIYPWFSTLKISISHIELRTYKFLNQWIPFLRRDLEVHNLNILSIIPSCGLQSWFIQWTGDILIQAFCGLNENCNIELIIHLFH